jgi:hypothetical protein
MREGVSMQRGCHLNRVPRNCQAAPLISEKHHLLLQKKKRKNNHYTLFKNIFKLKLTQRRQYYRRSLTVELDVDLNGG